MTDNRTIRTKLLIGASLSALLLTGVAQGVAQAQDRAAAGWGRGRGAGADPAAAVARAAQDQAVRQAQTNSSTQRALDALRRAAQTRTQMQDAQVQARIAAQAAMNLVPNGIGQGGLQAAPEIEIDPSLWVGANGPTQSAGEGGRTKVTVEQSESKAILTWDSFNVGRETDLSFNQQSADWVVLNRVRDADASQIHGSINAKGTVLILNQNGVLFGGTAAVNVRNLVASSASITDAAFLDRGIYSQLSGTEYLPSFTDAGGAITVEAGAQITTHAPTSATQGGGYVLLMGSQVTNAGAITTPKGQTLLSAGDDFLVRRGFGTAENPYSTTRGNEVRGLIDAGSVSGTVTNSGLIEATQGDITLAGRTIRQDGVALATTGVNQRGTIHLLNSASDTQGSVTLGANSLTTILPELEAKDTALNGQRDALIAQSNTANLNRPTTTNGGFDDRSLLADRLDQSRIEIVTGGDVLFAGGSSTSAQGGQVAVQANAGRITVADGARIDVSGVMGVALDMESNSIMVNVQGNEMRDSPVNRDSENLRSQNIWLDVRDLVLLPDGTGDYDGDRWYTGGGLLEVGGYLANMSHGIGEWAAVGGTITLAASEVVAHQGASFDISGGSLDYAAGWVNSTRVLGEDGKLYDIATAPAWVRMLAWGDAFVRNHTRWGTAYTQVWSHPLGGARSSRRWSEGYSVGRDAGQLILSAPTVILEADILAQTINGERQTLVREDGVTDGYKLGQHTVAKAGTLAIGGYTALGRTDLFDSLITIGEAPPLALALETGAALSEDLLNRITLDGDHLSAQRLGGLSIGTRGAVTITGDLVLGDGGALDITAPTFHLDGSVVARGGSVSVSNIFSTSQASIPAVELLDEGVAGITIGAGSLIDTRGQWVNALTDANIDAAAPFSGFGYLDGGSVTLRSTQDVTLDEASVVDVSSGGGLLPDGSVRGGRGGDLSLEAGILSGGYTRDGRLTLGGKIHGYGVTGGGTLLLQSGRISLGTGEGASDTTLVVSNALFSSGFGHYEIVGDQGISVADGAVIDVTMPVYRLGVDGRVLASGSDPAAALELWTPPLYLENPESGVLTQRGGASLTLRTGDTLRSLADVEDIRVSIGTGAVVSVDAGQEIALSGPGYIEMDGRLNAWGGDISITQRGILSQEAGGPADVPAHGRSLWIGENAVLDVAARAVTAVDVQGRRYGHVGKGGNIMIGGAIDHSIGSPGGGSAFVVIREGALLDASGAQAVLDLDGRPGTTVASDGGTISLGSVLGLYLHGDVRAAAGGAGAAGGTLDLSLGTTLMDRNRPVDRMVVPRELILTNVREDLDLFGTMTAREAADGLVYGHGALAVDQIEAGGFGSLGLAVMGQVSFAESMDITLGQSANIYALSLALGEAADADGRISITAPYLRLGGVPQIGTDLIGVVAVQIAGTSSRPTAASLTLNGGLIDLRDRMSFGANGTLNRTTGAFAYDRRDFADITLNSSGDIRLLAGANTNATRLVTAHNLILSSAQVYPATHAQTELVADTIRIGRSTDVVPVLPHSAFGLLWLDGRTIEQGGIVRAPLGALQIGRTGTENPAVEVDFLPGSVTSISGKGLIMPYGGTVDGIRYDYDGTPLSETLLGLSGFRAELEIAGQSIAVAEGAVIDVSGGGELTGAGFVSGRGGSIDVLKHALVDANPAFPSSVSGSSVYALVPSHSGIAPSAPEAGAGDPMIGQQITLDAGVPGLPAGTYTLMPSTFALQKGAFRVEIAPSANPRGTALPAVDLKNGSHIVTGHLGTAGTNVREALSRQVIVTPADVVRSYSLYNETSYHDFAVADAARLGMPRISLPIDVQNLSLTFAKNHTDRPALSFEGELRNTPEKGGWLGQVTLRPSSGSVEIVKAGNGPTVDFDGVTLDDAAINAMNAGRLMIGGTTVRNYGPPKLTTGATGTVQGNIVDIRSSTRDLIVRSSATLMASDIFLINGFQENVITVEQGAVLNTLGKGSAGQDARDGFIYRPLQAATFAVSNSYLTFITPDDGSNGFGPGRIDIGTCLSVCDGVTQLYSEGSIVSATNKAFNFDNAVRYGTRSLTLAMGGINIGTETSLAAAQATGVMPAGLNLSQSVLERLLQGDTSTGAPALETLVLTASGSINFYGTVTLDTIDATTGKSLLANLVMTSGGIYGHGSASDVATIRTGNFIWNGSTNPTPAIITGGAGTGSGLFNVEAERIEFGFGPDAVISTAKHDRLALGFSAVNLTASDRVTANHSGTLSVYQAQGAYAPETGFAYSGGNLTITAPLITSNAGASNAITAGGAVHLTGSGTAASISDLGGTLSVRGQTLTVDTTIALPSGRLTLAAENDLVLTDRAQIDLAGREIPFDDVKRYSWGGEVVLESRSGDILQGSGSVIDLSARNNNAGVLRATALHGSAGLIDLQGQVLGSSSGEYDAGGTMVPYQGGAVDLRAQSLGDFAALNTRLNEGEVFGGRAFQIKQGDLVVGDELKARDISVSLDGGALTVTGKVDASGLQVGSIRLYAADGLTIGGNAQLDAHGSLLRVDSYGRIINSPNRAIIELGSGNGTLTLASGARFDLRHGTGVAVGTGKGQHDGKDRGTLELNAPRLGARDIAIDAAGALTIVGARSIAVNAVRSYGDGDLLIGREPTVDDRPYHYINEGWMDQRHAESTAFIDAALANGSLMNGKLAGLNNATYRDAFHLRPTVEVASSGDLVISGDIDLSAYRYRGVNPNFVHIDGVVGSGEAGSLVLRSGGNLTLYGSVTDGFAPPPDAMPEEGGWVLLPGEQMFNTPVVVPRAGITLHPGSRFKAGDTLNYGVTLQPMVMAAGTRLPSSAALTGDVTLPANTVLSGDIFNADGSLAYAAGSRVAEATTLTAGMTLGAGFLLTGPTPLGQIEWAKNVPLPHLGSFVQNRDLDIVHLAESVTLPMGGVIPAGAWLELGAGVDKVDLRPAGGGKSYALAQMLPEGSQSWNLRLVAGADLGAADSRRVDPFAAHGNLVLADAHFGMNGKRAAGGGERLFTEEGAMNLIGDPSFAGLTESEVDARLLSEYGANFADLMGMSFSDMCAQNPTYCAGGGGGVPIFTEEGAMYWIGDPSLAGLTEAELDARLLSEYGANVQDLLGMSFADMCAQNPTHCQAGAGGGAPIFSEAGAMYWIGDPSLAGLTEVELDARLLAEYGAVFADLLGVSFADMCAMDPTHCEAGASGPITYDYTPAQAALSVLRTGTGDLELVSAGDLSVRSLFGVYTAGTSTISLADSRAAGLDMPRGTSSVTSILLGAGFEKYVDGGEESLYRAWYPDGGGNVSLTVGGDLTGDLMGRKRTSAGVGSEQFAGIEIGNWLWRQSSVQGLGAPTAWWINFGTYASTGASASSVVGFTGFGTLGGGNLAVHVAGDAGTIAKQGSMLYGEATRSQGLVLAVGATGRVIDGELIQTGGGDMDIRIGGTINPSVEARTFGVRQDLLGTIVNMRGTVRLDAQAVGGITPSANLEDLNPNHIPLIPPAATNGGGIVLAPGDATVRVSTRGDLVLGSVVDGGRGTQRNASAYDLVMPGGARFTGTGGASNWFSLWTDSTAVDIFSAGGNLRPLAAMAAMEFGGNPSGGTGVEPTDGRFLYPSIFRATAAGGSIYVDNGQGGPDTANTTLYSLMLAPGRKGQLEILAADSINAGGYTITPSGADMNSLVTPFNPGMSIYGFYEGYFHTFGPGLSALAGSASFSLFGYGYNTAGGNTPGAEGPARFYARDGDIIGLRTGEILDYPVRGLTIYEGARPVWMKAGRDIVNSGSPLGEALRLPSSIGQAGATTTSNLFVHNDATDVSMVQAGRDIRFSSFNIAGPGTLEITAGRSIVMEDVASVTSLGPIFIGDTRPGASISMMAGMANGVDWGAIRTRYLDPANLLVANPDGQMPPLEGSGKVAKVYDAELGVWLKDRYGFAGTGEKALAYFDALAPEQQRVFLREVYYTETRLAGREYNNPDSPRFGSYLRGREMIGTLFPDKDADGAEIVRTGDILMFGGSGVRTNFGGHVEMMAPGGQIVVGVQGNVPPATAGIVTQGVGDIRLFSEGSLLLGLSRILTTFGGDIFSWSEEGDINAGRGAKTTVLYTPPLRTYDAYGNVRLAPQVPSSGAGIGTLNPIAEVAPGDIDLIAPLGTIDAGEAGIRVSGNINLAALQVLNAANIQVQGEATGIPVVAAVNTGALTSASAASTAVANQAAQLAERTRPQARVDLPTIVQARFIGFGEQP
ncbi:filamentous hemagglutinin N-terminal domain-containing protein [Altererythrobacter xixiisoli]|uniref:Filamentous hemagglutinin N-terminal domain-containing protein n=1 Tax=Croceibacterium xixiisoli TaxID=1476466 RepID=A0A6I4TRN7_9SPHN|nr:filamentous haemagglutinin family protein [Croceibacterium xixiisoli]MXO97577.1 filamentous hemagglutinin N-terminal domain-containing protein [Croceibacterium xixiisoli]